MENNLSHSRHSHSISRISQKIAQSRAINQPSIDNYDERVIPTLRPGHVKTEPD